MPKKDHMSLPRVLLAGATGAIGRRLLPILLSNGIAVAGTTRNNDKAQALKASGITPYQLDVYDL